MATHNTIRFDAEGIDILRAIELANVVRAVGGFEELDDLKPGIEHDPQNCVLAATFNCSCEVSGLDFEPEDGTKSFSSFCPWFVYFHEKKYADALAAQLGEKVHHAPTMMSDERWAVELPAEVGYIATQFDEGNLDEKYYLDDESDILREE